MPAPQGLRSEYGCFAFRTNEVPCKDDESRRQHERADARNKIEQIEAHLRRIGEDPARHSAQAGQVHREEGDVEADEHEPESDFSEPIGELLAVDERKEIVAARDDGKNRAADQHVVQMADDEESVVRLKIEGRERHHHAGQPARYENGQAAEREEHRHRSAPSVLPRASR